MADSAIVPLEPSAYGVEMTKYYDTLESVIAEAEADVDLAELKDAIAAFNESANALEEINTSDADEDTVTLINTKIRDYQRGFVSQGGLPRRDYFRHVVFGPGIDTG
jgi:N-acetylated-alpha-linked acidic dipeptidase